MNNDVYVNADFTLPKGLPQPGGKDLTEVFGLGADVIDKDSSIRPVEGQPGTWRVGVRGDRSTQITRKHPEIKVNDSDFYIK